ncbi:hypothetical protein PIB30_059523 [Stylosanthes scabra]|uniref:Putative plant transposon protein domain-containing protein n=1 Tax=Stylosanthes scabra TaxID=79078 RepID=A0ABU6QJQ8_9FABA|nr:hypothetical protein [Stylosanthes scabra]
MLRRDLACSKRGPNVTAGEVRSRWVNFGPRFRRWPNVTAVSLAELGAVLVGHVWATFQTWTKRDCCELSLLAEPWWMSRLGHVLSKTWSKHDLRLPMGAWFSLLAFLSVTFGLSLRLGPNVTLVLLQGDLQQILIQASLFFAAREVLPELRIQIDDDALSPITAQINLRKWQRLTKPVQVVGYSLVREFYANAWRPEEEKKCPLNYSAQIRRTEINFSPESIHRVLKLRDNPLPNATSYHDKKANNNLRLDEVLACLCVEGAQWVRHPDGRLHFLRRTDLQPMARGCVISLLCKEAKALILGDTLIPQEAPIDGVAMGRVRGPREPRQNPPLDQEIKEEAPQQQHQHFQQQQNLSPDFMANFHNTIAVMQQHYDQRWDTFQQKFDDAHEENMRNFGIINQRMNQMDD